MKMMFDSVLIKELKETKGTMIVDDQKQRKEIGKGIVVEIGPGQAYGLPAYQSTVVKQGETVRYIKDQAIKIMIKDEEYWCIKERDCLMVEE